MPAYGFARASRPNQVVPFDWTGRKRTAAADSADWSVWTPVMGTRFAAYGQSLTGTFLGTDDFSDLTYDGASQSRRTPDGHWNAPGWPVRRPRQLVVGVGALAFSNDPMTYPDLRDWFYWDAGTGEIIRATMPPKADEYIPDAEAIADALAAAIWPTCPDVEIIVQLGSAITGSSGVADLSSWVVQDGVGDIETDVYTHGAPGNTMLGGDVLAVDISSTGLPGERPNIETGGQETGLGQFYVPYTDGFLVGVPYPAKAPIDANTIRTGPEGGISPATVAAPTPVGSPARTYRNFPRATFSGDYQPELVGTETIGTAAVGYPVTFKGLLKDAWNLQYPSYRKFRAVTATQTLNYDRYWQQHWTVGEIVAAAITGASGWEWAGAVDLRTDAAVAAYAAALALDFFS